MSLSTPFGPGLVPADVQFVDGSSGATANIATRPPWRRSTACQRCDGSAENGSSGSRSSDQPPAGVELVLELTRRPSPSSRRRRAGRPSSARSPPDRDPGRGFRARRRAAGTPDRRRGPSPITAVGATGPPTNRHDGAELSSAQSGQHLGDRELDRPVEDDTERALVAVLQHQDDGPREVRVAQVRRRDQQPPPHRLRHG